MTIHTHKRVINLLARPKVRAMVVLMLIDMAASTSLDDSGTLPSCVCPRRSIRASTERVSALVASELSSVLPAVLVNAFCLASIPS